MPVMGMPEGFGSKSVTVKLKGAKEYCKEVTIAKGAPQNPLTPDEFNSKYKDCASAVLSTEAVEKSLSILANFEKLSLPIERLVEIIAKK